jgi:hypothetical protein
MVKLLKKVHRSDRRPKHRDGVERMELFTKPHQLIQLKDSEEEEEQLQQQQDLKKKKKAETMENLPSLSFESKGSEDSPKQDMWGGQGSTNSIKLKLGSRRKVNKSFQRLDATQSSDSSVSFDAKSNQSQLKEEAERATTAGSEGGVGCTADSGRADFGTLAIGGVGKSATSILKLKFKSLKTFQKLENFEGSYASYAYEPPSDYKSLVGTESAGVNFNSATLKLLQIASQSHFSTGGTNSLSSPSLYEPPPSSLLVVERDGEEGRQLASTPTQGTENGAKDDGEFRQFVFDKNFSSIEAVNVEKSDSGAGGDDIFRMAAVETVTRMSLQKALSPLPVRRNPFSPSNNHPSPKPFSPSSGALPKSPHQRSFISSNANRSQALGDAIGRSRVGSGKVEPISKSSSPAKASHTSSFSTSLYNPKGKSHQAKQYQQHDDSLFDDFSKKRFQELVMRTGKLSVQSPLSSSSTKGFKDQLGAANSRTVSPSMHSKATSASESQLTIKEGLHFMKKKQNSTSPLGTLRHFGNADAVGHQQRSNSAASRRAFKASSKPSSVQTFSSVVSTVSNANATISTGPDENAELRHPERAKSGAIFTGRGNHSPYHFEDDVNPFRVGEDDTIPDPAWDVAKVSFSGRNLETSKNAGSTSSIASRGDNSLLIESIKQATHQRSRATRYREAQLHRPDPSPRGLPHSSSDSVLDYAPTNHGGRSSKIVRTDDQDVILMSKSEGAMMDSDHETLGSAPNVPAPPVAIQSYIHGRSHGSKAPSGVPEHAILASMLFRQTEVLQRNEADLDEDPTPQRAMPEPDWHYRRGQERKPGTVISVSKAFDVPTAIEAVSTASVVSSVTEEASTFYHRNLQSSYKAQAHAALNNYHSLRASQQKKQAYYGVPQRKQVPWQQRAQHEQPRSKWVSSSSSRKTTSSTGRPTWLDRVEEEHMRMFS